MLQKNHNQCAVADNADNEYYAEYDRNDVCFGPFFIWPIFVAIEIIVGASIGVVLVLAR